MFNKESQARADKLLRFYNAQSFVLTRDGVLGVLIGGSVHPMEFADPKDDSKRIGAEVQILVDTINDDLPVSPSHEEIAAEVAETDAQASAALAKASTDSKAAPAA